MKKIVAHKMTKRLKPRTKIQPGRIRAAIDQVIRFAVVGDSHVGYGNSINTFKSLLPKVVSSGNKKFVIFGGDNAQAGANHGKFAQQRYKDFKTTVDAVLRTKNIPYKASIGNWETTTRGLFRQNLGSVAGQMNFPGTQGKVQYVWLDNAPGQFSTESINLLNKLDANHYYIIDFHWPLNVKGITITDPSHVLSLAETNKFFKAIPSAARDNVLAIFTHHAHKFYQKNTNIYPGFTKTKFFVCGCSGDYKCNPTGGRGYYDATLTIHNNQYSVKALAVHQ
ncbi:metallophosphoesterase [Paenibacillus sp. LMG 31456]|uniref:Metallophosphoesterase n=1 Tax=Paenibacillus foliorum TaxID=2654974 RepID=A0A972GQK4_9BACL|nr:metallophosphoesterase [Paenibacillus foliorum]NOU94355.1 metallophosphoesterase [Paenibacillus foliorum]